MPGGVGRAEEKSALTRCTPGMGMNLWGESPLWVNQHRIWSRISPPMITTSRRQVQFREVLCGGSPSAKVRADEQKSHTRPSLWGEWANDHEALWLRDTVNAAVVH